LQDVHGASFKGPTLLGHEYEWVLSNASPKPPLTRDKIGELPAACAKPFYLARAHDFEGKLAAHNATNPAPVVLDPPKKKPVRISIDPELQRQSQDLG
jgi:hypothetical protein